MKIKISERSTSEFFQHTVTEFMLILAFFFLALATVFHTQKVQIEKDIGDYGPVLKEIPQLLAEVQGLSDRLGLAHIDPSSTLDTITQVRNRINKIKRQISTPINIEKEWEILVFIKNAMNSSGISRDDFVRLTNVRSTNEKSQRELNKTLINLRQCARDFNAQRKRCGTGHPICGGGSTFLAKLTLLDEQVVVENVQNFEGPVRTFSNQAYPYQQFKDIGDAYFDHSALQLPECRFQVRVLDKTSPTSKETYKRAINAVDERFYKYEIK